VKWIRLAKLLTAELQGNVLDTCLQFHGGYGYMDEYQIRHVARRPHQPHLRWLERDHADADRPVVLAARDAANLTIQE
jgi:alkylation response protein AidB-like acyl-CoA dehydrogenase